MLKTVSVIGLGYIGLPTAAMLASRKVRVLGVDVNQRAVDTINQGKIHIVEPDLDMLVHAAVTGGYLSAQTSPVAADAFMIAVPTPFFDDLSPDLSYVESAVKAIAPVLQKGDRITAINDQPIKDWISATRIIRDSPEKLLNFTVLRDGQSVQLQIMPQGKKDNLGNDFGQIGAMVEQSEIVIPEAYKTTVVYGPGESLIKSFEKTEQLAVMTVSSMGKMLSGMIGLDNLSGPITIAKVAKQSFDISWEMVLSTAALISLSLAVLNLLPIPVLDGGHIVYHVIELIRGKPLSEGVQMVGLNIGLLLLAGFMVLAIGNDISRLF